MDEKGGGCGRRKYQIFSSNLSCHTVPKSFVEEPLCVSESFGYRKVLELREGAGITNFRQNCFVSEHRSFS